MLKEGRIKHAQSTRIRVVDTNAIGFLDLPSLPAGTQSSVRHLAVSVGRSFRRSSFLHGSAYPAISGDIFAAKRAGMDDTVVRVTLSLIGPAVLLVFGLAFAGAWAMDRRRVYLLLLAIACLLFTLGAVSQVLYWPSATGLNALVSGGLYTAAVLLAAQSILVRSDCEFPWVLYPVLLVGFIALIGYFFYVERSLLARVYVQNFGYGLVLLAAALRLRTGASRRHVDRILFWVLLAFALHFFPRTLLTIGLSAPAGERAFANSVFWQTLQLSLAVLGVSLALAILVAAFSDLLEDTRRERNTDELTGILNRRGFEEAVRVSLAGSADGGSLVLCDVDYFKRVNDTHGHDAGDAVLKAMGRLLRETARKDDIVGRFGGEEFLIFLPAADLTQATQCAERVRNVVAGYRFPFVSDGEILTASFGIATLAPGETWESLFKRADTCLYAAKRAGRNCSVAASGTSNDGALPPVRAPDRRRERMS
jgi:diguanylate cyclase (GGDEF)-like protein